MENPQDEDHGTEEGADGSDTYPAPNNIKDSPPKPGSKTPPNIPRIRNEEQLPENHAPHPPIDGGEAQSAPSALPEKPVDDAPPQAECPITPDMEEDQGEGHTHEGTDGSDTSSALNNRPDGAPKSESEKPHLPIDSGKAQSAPSAPPEKPVDDVPPPDVVNGTDTPPAPNNKEEVKKPREIRSRRDQSPTKGSKPPTNVPTKKLAKPELICRKDQSGQWAVVLSDIPKQGKEIWHDTIQLSIESGECILEDFCGNLSIKYTDHRSDEEIPLCDNPPAKPLIFKLGNDWTGLGRRLHAVTKGCFIIFAPRQWTPIGKPPVEPEYCTNENYLAHFFVVKETTGSMNGIDGFEEYPKLPKKHALKLDGSHIFDNSTQGILFIGDAPKLNVPPNIVWARVGEEGRKEYQEQHRDTWKGSNFKPEKQSLKDVLSDRQGRFFLRVYEDSLKDSIQFRYLRDLQAIYINGEPYSENTILVPTEHGYLPTELQFIGSEGTAIELATTTNGSHATVLPKSLIILDPHPEGDEVSCSLRIGTHHVDTVIKLPRIWWRMQLNGNPLDEWYSKPLLMTQQEFIDHGKNGMVICLRLPSQIKSVKVGFDTELAGEWPQYKGENYMKLRMTDFSNYSQINQPLDTDASLNIQLEAGTIMTLIQIIAEVTDTAPLPQCGGIYPYVQQASGGYRRGKGFSCAEIRAAGITGTNSLKIAKDKRRRSVHKRNINELRKIKNS